MSGYVALRSATAWLDLSGRGKIRVTGEDRARLLHAMSTNDVKNLAPNAGLYAFFLNDKGRILSDCYIYHLADSFFLDTEPEAVDTLRDHLDRYIIADDVTLEDETAGWTAIDIEGPTALETASALGIPSPDQPFATLPWETGFVARVAATGALGLRVFLPAAEKADFMARLAAASIPEATSGEARIVRLENGIPRYAEDITERYLVQETQALHAVHFNKGCYLGQEIVERVRSRGQVHRLLAPVRIAGTTPPAPGTKLLADGNPVAEITSAVFSPALAQLVGLAYVRSEALEARPALVVAGTDPPVAARVA